MMEEKKTKNDVFFGENGITSTSADQVANNAKEYYEGVLEELNSVSFFNTDKKIIGSETSDRTHNGWTIDEVMSIKEKLHVVFTMKDLISWLREAIAARDEKMRVLKRMTVEDYAEKFGLEMPVCPHEEKAITREDVIAQMTVKERHEMLKQEAIAATYGKYIHKNCPFAEARKRLAKIKSNPTELNGEGRDTIITTYSKSVDEDVVKNLFFEMKQEYREAQSKLNGYNHMIDAAVTKDEIEKDNKFAEEYKIYSLSYQEIYAKFQAWKKEEQAKIEKLGIIIPEHLRGVYTMVNTLGKNKDKK